LQVATPLAGLLAKRDQSLQLRLQWPTSQEWNETEKGDPHFLGSIMEDFFRAGRPSQFTIIAIGHFFEETLVVILWAALFITEWAIMSLVLVEVISRGKASTYKVLEQLVPLGTTLPQRGMLKRNITLSG